MDDLQKASLRKWMDFVTPEVRAAFRAQQKTGKKVETDGQLLDAYFTREERLRMAYVPLVVTESIWEYVDKVTAYCASHRIDVVKKLTRAVKMMKKDYYAWLHTTIDSDHIKRANACAQQFKKDFLRDMFIMWFTINGELKKKHPDSPDQDMRTDALCAMLLVRVVKKFCADVDDEIKARMGIAVSTINPKIKNLDTIMDGYVGYCEIDRTELIRRCEVIFRKDMETINYTG